MLLEKEFKQGAATLFVGLIIPFITTLSIYPISALSLIESHVSSVDAKLEQVLKLLPALRSNQSSSSNAKPTQPPTSQAPLEPTSKFCEAVTFLNQWYDIQIDPSDDIETLKEKIAEIDSDDKSSQIFKNRVANASSIDEVRSIVNMHYVVLKK